MEELIRYVIQGFPVGCVYALVAVGLVLTYKTSGVFNLAFGAQAFVSAAVFYDTRKTHDWPLVPALLLAVFVVGPLLGFLMDRLLFRYLRTASTLAKLVSSLGLLVAIPSLVQLWFGQGAKFSPPSLSPDPDRVYHFGDYSVNGNELITIIATLAVVVALMLMFRFTALGLQMRAVVESPRMVELAGVNADRVGSVAWMLSSFLAGLAGVLLAPLFASVDAATFTVLIVAATAAAAFGRLSSIPLTLAGGIVLGVTQQALAGYLPADSVLARNIRPSVPFVMLFLLVLFWPGLRTRREAADPLSGVDPPPPGLAVTYQDPRLAKVMRYVFVAFLVAVVVVPLFLMSSYWRFLVTQGLIYTTIFLSVTVVVGMSGQISLCQITFAGVGAFTAAQLADDFGVPILLGMLIGAVVAAAVGAIIAIPTLRLGGLYLALATLAFGLMVETVIFPLDWVGGGDVGIRVPRPVIGSTDLATNDEAFFLLALAVFGICGAVVVLVRRGTTGRYLAALRGSELAASAIGINPARAKVTAFALSAAIAGVGGAMLAMQTGQTSPADYPTILGLVWVALVVTLGPRTVDGAVNAGMSFILLPEIMEVVGVPQKYQIPLQFALYGFGAITFAKHPEGIVEHSKRRSIEAMNRFLVRRFGEPPGAPPPPDAGVLAERPDEPVLPLAALAEEEAARHGAEVTSDRTVPT